MALVLPPHVAKEFAAMPREDAQRLLRRLERIADAPDVPHPGVVAMSGQVGLFRVRQGNWRAVFVIEDGDVIVDRVGHRRGLPMSFVIPKPLNETKETVTLSRSDWDALIDRIEDVEDVAAVAARCAHEAAVGKAIARRNYLSAAELRRLLDGVSPVKVWRDKRGLSQRALAKRAGVGSSYLAEIETGRKPGSAEMLLKLARALEVPMEHLISVGEGRGG